MITSTAQKEADVSRKYSSIDARNPERESQHVRCCRVERSCPLGKTEEQNTSNKPINQLWRPPAVLHTKRRAPQTTTKLYKPTSRVRHQLSLPPHRCPPLSKLVSRGQQPLVLPASSRLRHPPGCFLPDPTHNTPNQAPNLIGRRKRQREAKYTVGDEPHRPAKKEKSLLKRGRLEISKKTMHIETTGATCLVCNSCTKEGELVFWSHTRTPCLDQIFRFL